MLRSIITWFMIFIITTAGYSFKDDILSSRVVANLIPAQGYQSSNNSMKFYKARDGHFYIKSKINNRHIVFLVDTGASDVTISAKDAKKMGINMHDLVFSRTYSTANGKINVAPVIIPKMQIGSFTITNVEAGISQNTMNTPLLGMSVLERFAISINNNTMTLTY